MRTHFYSLILILITAICLTGCKKDLLTQELSGTYVVSGLMTGFPNDSVAINNDTIDISRQDRHRMSATFYLPHPMVLTMEYNVDLSGGEVHYFEGFSNSSGITYQASMAFYKSDPDSVYVRYFFQDDIPATEVADYILTGRKR